ncbi:MAG: DNA mismatch endonuclease Vsr [Opitutales bacterium]|nr:DNA mismatch endonuclease Vsr [Opitutales bacterium]
MDRVSNAVRSRNMAAVRSRDTKPEVKIRSLLHRLGFRFRLCDKSLPGKPDIVLKKYKTVIFVNGCFWHRHENCLRSKLPETNKEFWEKKIRSNVERDRKNKQELAEQGWRVLVIWECEVKKIIDNPQMLKSLLFESNLEI